MRYISRLTTPANLGMRRRWHRCGGYALSPIDLIPYFIPVLVYLDDVILVPLGIWAVVKLSRKSWLSTAPPPR